MITISDEELTRIETNLGYHFVFPEHLQKEINDFYACFTPGSFSQGAIDLIRYKKSHFIMRLFKTLDALTSSQGDKEKIYKMMEGNDALLQAFFDKFKLIAALEIATDDPIFSYLTANATLFLLHGIMVDCNASQNAEQAPAEYNKFDVWFKECVSSIMPKFPLPRRSRAEQFDFFPANKNILENSDNFIGRFADPEITSANYERFQDVTHEFPYNYEEKKHYEKAVLHMAQDIKQAENLSPLADNFPSSSPENRNSYYGQFLPYILEETRANIRQTYDVLLKGLEGALQTHKAGANRFEIEINNPQGWLDEDSGLMMYNAVTKKLPPLEHGFFMEVILLVPPTATQVRDITKNIVIAKQGRKKWKKEDGGFTKEIPLKLTALSNTIKGEQFSSHEPKWTAYWLAGLVSQARMYEACITQPTPSFIPDIITGGLQPWPIRRPSC